MCQQIWPLRVILIEMLRMLMEGMKLRLFAMVNASFVELLLASILWNEILFIPSTLSDSSSKSVTFLTFNRSLFFLPLNLWSYPEDQAFHSTSMEIKHSQFWVKEPSDDSQLLRFCCPPRTRRAMSLGDKGSKVSKGLPKVKKNLVTSMI